MVGYPFCAFINLRDWMQRGKKKEMDSKLKLHPRNKHRERYDLSLLSKQLPELKDFIHFNIHGIETIDFSNPDAVRTLNKALLKTYYHIKNWHVPSPFLCPPVPGRVDYIHYLADLLASKNHLKIPTGAKINCLDIGVGANCIYPLVGNCEYGWRYVGADIDPVALKIGNIILEQNKKNKRSIQLRMQLNPSLKFTGIIQPNEKFDVTLCNPPFYGSEREALKTSKSKISSLSSKSLHSGVSNFGGQQNELWCEGGEAKFISDMITESTQFKTSCFWFTSLVSKKENLAPLYKKLAKVNAIEIQTIEMGQGTKISRFIAWTFLTENQQSEWVKTRWNT